MNDKKPLMDSNFRWARTPSLPLWAEKAHCAAGYWIWA